MVSTLLEILAALTFQQQRLSAYEVVSTLLEILAVIMDEVHHVPARTVFQPFLRF